MGRGDLWAVHAGWRPACAENRASSRGAEPAWVFPCRCGAVHDGGSTPCPWGPCPLHTQPAPLEEKDGSTRPLLLASARRSPDRGRAEVLGRRPLCSRSPSLSPPTPLPCLRGVCSLHLLVPQTGLSRTPGGAWCRGRGSTLVPHPQTGPLVRIWEAPWEPCPSPQQAQPPCPHLVRAPGVPHAATGLSAQSRQPLHHPPPHPHVASSPSESTSVRLLPQWWPIPWPGQSCCGQQGGEGASTEKGQLGMEIPLVFSHGQQGLFKEYIQLKIDFSV